jgi:hypothetical protein
MMTLRRSLVHLRRPPRAPPTTTTTTMSTTMRRRKKKRRVTTTRRMTKVRACVNLGRWLAHYFLGAKFQLSPVG